MDLERLDEALEFYGHPNSYTGHEEVVLSATAAYRDLLVNGERVEWCETHKRPATESTCGAFVRDLADEPNYNLIGGVRDCRIVSKLLIPSTEED